MASEDGARELDYKKRMRVSTWKTECVHVRVTDTPMTSVTYSQENSVILL